MKKLLLSLILFTGIATGFSQGRLFFGNAAVGVDAPVYTRETGSPVLIQGSAYRAQLWCGGLGQTEAQFVPVGNPVIFQSGAAAGYFVGANRGMTNGQPGIAGGLLINFPTTAGSVVQAQVRVWRFSDGATWDAASAAGGYLGKSGPINVTLTETPTAAPNMVGLSFGGPIVPEPSITALGVLGLVAFAVFRRRRKE